MIDQLAPLSIEEVSLTYARVRMHQVAPQRSDSESEARAEHASSSVHATLQMQASCRHLTWSPCKHASSHITACSWLCPPQRLPARSYDDGLSIAVQVGTPKWYTQHEWIEKLNLQVRHAISAMQ